jgi:hypothetical protein
MTIATQFISEDALRRAMEPENMGRFFKFVNIEIGKCWEWTGCKHPIGYGMFQIRSKKSGYAHKIIWEYFNGKVPEGKELDHLCRNRSCVNPFHLEPVSHVENMRRGANSIKTHCPRGHKYDGFNPYRNNGFRYCIACLKQQKRDYYERTRAKKVSNATN